MKTWVEANPAPVTARIAIDRYNDCNVAKTRMLACHTMTDAIIDFPMRRNSLNMAQKSDATTAPTK